jgi:hypothetical protein
MSQATPCAGAYTRLAKEAKALRWQENLFMSGNTIATGAAPVPEDIRERTNAPTRSPFFWWMSLLLLSLVLIGFAPTFYLRSFFDTPIPLLGFDYAHGVILTAWYIWLVVQTALVRIGRTATHRRLGVIGAVIATGVVVAGPMATLAFASRPGLIGIDWDVDVGTLPVDFGQGISIAELISMFVWSTILVIAMFGGLVIAAVALRRRPETHKRLMLLASISILGPALSRIFNWPPFPGEDSPLLMVAHLALIGAVVVYDVISTRRPHAATLIACGAFVLSLIATPILASSEFGMAVTRMLE